MAAGSRHDFEKLKIEREGRVLVARIEEPPRNYLTAPLRAELGRLVAQLARDRSVGAVVLTGGLPGTFITHADVPELVESGKDIGRPVPRPVARAALGAAHAINRLPALRAGLLRTPLRGVLELRLLGDLFRRMNRMNQVFIAAINGYALGGGFETALACDVRVAADGPFKVGLIESWLGLATATGTAQRLARSLGSARTLELLVSGRIMTPQEARELGLVERVVPPDQLLAEAVELGQRWARRQPETTGVVKRSLYDGGGRPLGRAIAIEQAAFASVIASAGTVRACETYAAAIADVPSGEPLPADELLPAWYDGTAVDLVNSGG